jgi:ferredoxin-NADP reductase/cytochrome b involved in lipid metabolism
MGSRRSGKARAPPLEPGFSQLHWMRLTTTEEDQTNGVGLADPDEVAAGRCARWTLDEVRRHNSRHDCWMVLRGRVYNVTAYLRYHPGSVEELMRSAGDDGTALFDEAHPYVNAEAILESCCVGLLAPAAAPPKPVGAAAPGPALHPDSWRSFRLTSASAAGSDSVLLRFALRDGQRLGLALGEHLQLRVRGPNGTELHRAYTPVSGHKAAGFFELLVFIVDGGLASPLLCDYLRPPAAAAPDAKGEARPDASTPTVELRGPRGPPVYGAYGPSKLCLPSRAFLCGGSGVFTFTAVGFVTAGSGITPALAMVSSLMALHASGARNLPALTLLHACRRPAHVPTLGRLLEAVRTLPRMRLLVVASGAPPAVSEAPPPVSVDPAGAVEELFRLEEEARLTEGGATGGGEGGIPFPPADGSGVVRVSLGILLGGNLLAAWMPPAAVDTAAMLCGPSLFNRDVAAWLAEAGHKESSVHVF